MSDTLTTSDPYKDAKRRLAEAQTLQAEAQAEHFLALARQTGVDILHAEQAHAENMRILRASAEKEESDAKEASYGVEVGRLALEHSEISMARERRVVADENAANRLHYVYDLGDAVMATGGILPAISDLLVGACVEELGKWHRSAPDGQPFEIILNTQGGNISAGFVLIDYIRWLREQGHFVTIRVLGMAASMGAVVLQAADQRIMGKHSVMLLHKASFSAGGTYDQVVSNVNLVDIYHKRIFELLAERSKSTTKSIATLFEKGDFWMSAADAQKKGFVDELA